MRRRRIVFERNGPPSRGGRWTMVEMTERSSTRRVLVRIVRRPAFVLGILTLLFGVGRFASLTVHAIAG